MRIIVCGSMTNDLLTDFKGRIFLGLPASYELPDTSELVQDARAIIQTNVVLHRELSPRGIDLSPIWEETSSGTVIRATALPPEFVNHYFSGAGLQAISDLEVLELIADVMPWMVDDPGGAALALESTHQIYFCDEAPLRPLRIPYKGHFKLLSLLLADFARKADGELDPLEWLASLGLPLDDFREPEDPPAITIKTTMRRRMQEMWDREQSWYQRALKLDN